MKTPELVVSTIPHVHGGNSIQKMMINFMIALLPAIGMSLYLFGSGALVVIAISVVSAVAWEVIIQKVVGKPVAISNLTGAASGLVLAMMLPPTAPWWLIRSTIMTLSSTLHPSLRTALPRRGFSIFPLKLIQ